MKILLTHRFFWPDTAPYATMLRSIAKRLAAEGHDVTVFSTQPSYHSSLATKTFSHENVDGFKVVRMSIFKERKSNLPLRALNVLIYAFGLRRHILKVADYDIVTASTFPPIVAAKVVAGAARKIGAKFVYHFQDLHPEVSLYSGQLKRGWVFDWLQAIDNKTCQQADALVVLSKDMSATLRNRQGNDHLQPEIINNILLESFETAPSKNGVALPDNKFNILFAGNIGKYQNLELIVKAAHKLTDLKDVQFWFMGEGAAKQRLIKLAGSLLDKSVFFLPQQHHNVAQDFMEKASLNLVSLAPNIFRVAYPSKTLSILAKFAPIFAIIESESELAQMVSNYNIGYVADQNDPQAVSDSIRYAYSKRENLGELRDNAKQLYNSNFAKEKTLDRWCSLMEKLGATKN